MRSKCACLYDGDIDYDDEQKCLVGSHDEVVGGQNVIQICYFA